MEKGQSFAASALEPSTDVSAADWVVAGVRHFQYDVGSLVPYGFPAHARIFHPAHRSDGTEVRWAEVARANDRQAHPAMQWPAITGAWPALNVEPQPGVWDLPPSEGSLAVPTATRLAALLTAYTATPQQCWFAVWEGFGDLAVPEAGVPRVSLPQRPMLLLSGPLSAVTTSLASPPRDQRANLWWPADRTWCVATDIDLMSTYVAASTACIDAVLADPNLEAMPVTEDQRVTWDSDEINTGS